ncbi:branched-chain amino acid ABC transporter permease [Cupriavidus necator]|uniref:branched-chain amino acid ABC transporter permease n=1 Tax=Cupriavidus necator TaxID=106590 RepID=UPI002786E660|nr:branched-chain amino acid ABC transporter permease [Cupriavidus necator]MDQ0143793.1 branched-chain amino acid transport system permease protein [Cupriavidus necator]
MKPHLRGARRPEAQVPATAATPALWLALLAGCLVALAAPWLFTGITTQLTFLWLMVLFALTWDVMGGQMGYNSFGNIVFFGVGAYVCAVVQRDFGLGYFAGLAVGTGLAALAAVAAALALGPAMLGLRGHYFAIGTLGLGIACADAAAGWNFIGAGSGMTLPLFPGAAGSREPFFYYAMLVLAVATLLTLRWLYARPFGLALNAIRDDEDKAEALGLHTTRYKIAAWCLCAVFLGMAGALTGNLVGFIDPRELAFASASFGVWMVVMAILGGKGTLWGPVLGAALFHLTQELFWTYLLNWQRVALGVLIVLIVVLFPTGIMGWLHEFRAHRRRMGGSGAP